MSQSLGRAGARVVFIPFLGCGLVGWLPRDVFRQAGVQIFGDGSTDMAFLGNVLWFIFGGWLLFIFYALAAIIFFPIFIPIFRLARYAAWPFGRSVVTQSELQTYRELNGLNTSTPDLQAALRFTSGLINIVWMFTAGLFLALMHILCALANLVPAFTIIGIPVAIANFIGNLKMVPVALMPLNKVIVPSALADEIRLGLVRKDLKLS